MIGIILTILAIVLYINGNKKWSILLFACFSYRGFVLLTDNIMGLKNQDAALIYFLVIFLYSLLKEKNIPSVQNRQLNKAMKCFAVFMLFSILFSALHYGLDLYQLIQGSRRYFIIFSFYFISKLSYKDSKWIIDKIVLISVITGSLYIIQSLTGLPVLPESEQQLSTDSIDGTLRYYNYPPALEVSIFLLLFCYDSMSKYRKYFSFAILLIALVCTQGRTLIASILFVIVLSLLMKGQIRKIMLYGVIGAICLIPFLPLVMERFQGDDKNKSSSDITSILNGDFTNYEGQGGTMVFRFALVYERFAYLMERPFGEQVFGMGLLSDQQTTLVNRMYNFRIGLVNRETGSVTQLSTPDIAYGNLICKLGLLGMSIYIWIWGVMIWLSYKYRKYNEYVFSLFCLLFVYFYTSFSGATISYAEYSVIPFILMSFLKYRDNEKDYSLH